MSDKSDKGDKNIIYKKNTPEGWVAPYPAWSADFTGIEAPCLVLYGMQSESGDFSTFQDMFRHSLKDDMPPHYCEYGRFTDIRNIENFVIMAYWPSRTEHQKWRMKARIHQWLAEPERLQEEAGYWIETLMMPLERFETLFSSTQPAGAAAISPHPIENEIIEHGYWGSMRDRIPLSTKDKLESGGKPVSSDDANGTDKADNADKANNNVAKKGRTGGKHIQFTAPENLCMIHSAQDWTNCKDAERATYLDDVHPTLKEGMTFLANQGLDIGCWTCRFIDEVSEDGTELSKSCGFAYFASMADLEAWSKSHPTHLKIFGSFQRMVKKYNFEIDLKLWHEVAVLTGDHALFEYINCHDRTGLLAAVYS